jgi:hypothetical protein
MAIPFAIPAALSGVLSHWKLVGIALLVLAIGVQTIRLSGAERRADRAEFHLRECQTGRQEDRRAYEQAQRDAAAKNRAEVQRIETEQERVTHEVTRDLHTRLERLRRELQQKAPPAGGNPKSPGAGPDGQSRPGTDDKAGVCLAPEELLRGAENEERHDRLIDWVERQLGVKR